DQQGPRRGDAGERAHKNARKRGGRGRDAEVASLSVAGDSTPANQSVLHDEDSGTAPAEAGCRVIQAHVVLLAFFAKRRNRPKGVRTKADDPPGPWVAPCA